MYEIEKIKKVSKSVDRSLLDSGILTKLSQGIVSSDINNLKSFEKTKIIVDKETNM